MPTKMSKRLDEHGLEPGTADKPVLEPPEGAKIPDAREIPVNAMPDDFLDPKLGTPMDDSLGITAAVEAELTGEESAEEESEPAEEESEALEEVDELEEEAEEEAEEASEEDDSSKKKGKSRSQRRNEQLAREKTRADNAERELEGYKRLEPQINFMLQDPELAQATRNRMAGKPITQADSSVEQFKVPEKPTPPVKPTNFSRERAIEDPESPDAKYLDDVETYPIVIENWREKKEEIQDKKTAYDQRKTKERQQEEAQKEWWGNLTEGLTEAAQKDPNIDDDQIESAVAEAVKILGDQEAYSPTVLWQFSQNYLGRTRAVKKAKKTTPKKKEVPAPPSVTPSADAVKMPKGWVESDQEWANKAQEDLLNLR